MTRQEKEDFLEEEGWGNGGWLAEQTDDAIDLMYENCINEDEGHWNDKGNFLETTAY